MHKKRIRNTEVILLKTLQTIKSKTDIIRQLLETKMVEQEGNISLLNDRIQAIEDPKEKEQAEQIAAWLITSLEERKNTLLNLYQNNDGGIRHWEDAGIISTIQDIINLEYAIEVFLLEDDVLEIIEKLEKPYGNWDKKGERLSEIGVDLYNARQFYEQSVRSDSLLFDSNRFKQLITNKNISFAAHFPNQGILKGSNQPSNFDTHYSLFETSKDILKPEPAFMISGMLCEFELSDSPFYKKEIDGVPICGIFVPDIPINPRDFYKGEFIPLLDEKNAKLRGYAKVMAKTPPENEGYATMVRVKPKRKNGDLNKDFINNFIQRMSRPL